MTYDRALDISGNWAAILTAAVAVIAYGGYLRERHDKRRRLERHLKDEKELAEDQGQRTVLHLMAHLGMTESEVLDAAFRSKRVRCLTAVDWQGRAEALMFEFDSDNVAAGPIGRRKF